MATASTGWLCTHDIGIAAETDTTATIRVACYWQNSGWKYNINNVSAWVVCNGQSQQVMASGSVNAQSSNSQAVLLGYADFVINKTTSSQSIQCYATITSNSTYASGTKSSGATYAGVSAKPSYTIKYNANGGSGAPGNQTKWYNENITLSSTKPTRSGYSFVRWNTNTSNTGTGYNPGATYSSNAGLTLYAIWKSNDYTVTYNANGGTGAPAAQTKVHGTNLTLSSTIPTKSGYIFKGWSTSANGSVEYAAGGTYTSNANLTLYAIWEVDYTKPIINNLIIQRCTSAGEVAENGTYVKVSFDWSADEEVQAAAVQWKQQSDKTDNWSTSPITVAGMSGAVDAIAGDDQISIETSYIFRVYVTDVSDTTYSEETYIGTVKFPIDVKKGGTGVAIGKVAEKDGLEIAMTIWDRFGQLISNGLAEYKTGGVDIDCDTTLAHLVLSETNTPNNSFYYVMTLFYGDKTTTNNRTQIAIPYIYNISQNKTKMYIRQNVGGTWTKWVCVNGECVLYNNASGSNGTITLSDSAANYEHIKIYYYDSEATNVTYNCIDVYSPNGKCATLTATNALGDAVYSEMVNRVVSISGSSISTHDNRYEKTGWKPNAATEMFYKNYIKIVKVVGYKA